MLINGLKEVYNKYIESDYLEKVKGEIAKKKLLTGNVSRKDRQVVFKLKTQDNLSFVCLLRKNNWVYSIELPIVYFNSLDKFKNSSTLIESSFPSSILDTLETHLRFANKSIVHTVNGLDISFYTSINNEDFLVGVSDGKIVFMLRLCSSLFITNIETKNNIKFISYTGDYIVFKISYGTNIYFIRLSTNDYSYELSDNSDFSK